MNNQKAATVEKDRTPSDKVQDHKRREREADMALRRLRNKTVSIEGTDNEDTWDALLDID